MPRNFKDRLGAKVFGSLKVPPLPAPITQVLRLMEKVRVTTDKSDWIFVGHAIQIYITVTRNADSAGVFQTGVVTISGLNGTEKPGDGENGITIEAMPAGENQVCVLTIAGDDSGAEDRYIPTWLRARITTDGTANDFADVDMKIVGYGTVGVDVG